MSSGSNNSVWWHIYLQTLVIKIVLSYMYDEWYKHSTKPFLTLDNLVAGHYIIRLTVTDAKGRKFKYSDLLHCFMSIFMFCTTNLLKDTLSSMPF